MWKVLLARLQGSHFELQHHLNSFLLSEKASIRQQALFSSHEPWLVDGRLLVTTAQAHAVLARDFNARVGSLPDPWVAECG